VKCRFLDNRNGSGGNVAVAPLSIVRHCVFAGNWSSGGALTTGSSSGAGDMHVVGCTFTDQEVGHALQMVLAEDDEGLVVVNCVFAGNDGGAITVDGFESETAQVDDNQVTNCLIAGNQAGSGAAIEMPTRAAWASSTPRSSRTRRRRTAAPCTSSRTASRKC
jgi:hypothetical protein